MSNCIYECKKRMSSKIFIWRLNMDMSSFSLVIIFFRSSRSYTSVTHEKHPLERSDSWGASRVRGGGGGGGVHKVNGVFRHPKHSFSKTVSRVEFFFFLKRRLIVFVWTDENGGFPKRSFHTYHTAKGKGCYSISFVISFSCGRAKTIGIRYVCTRIFSKTEKNISVVKNFRYVWTWTRPNFHGVVNRDSLLSSTLSGLFSEAPTHRAPYS